MAGTNGLTRLHGNGLNFSTGDGDNANFHFHGFQQHHRIACLHLRAGLQENLPNAARYGCRDAARAFFKRRLVGWRQAFLLLERIQPLCRPIGSFGGEGGALRELKCRDRMLVIRTELLVFTK